MKLNWLRNLKRNISMEKTKNKLTLFADHLDSEYGKRGTEEREIYEKSLSVLS